MKKGREEEEKKKGRKERKESLSKSGGVWSLLF